MDSWIDRKEREVQIDETSVILSEEHFYERYKRYSVIKHELDQKEPQIKNIFTNGNDLLKTSSSTGMVADLARHMMNLNTKWTSFYKKSEYKYKYNHEIDALIIELKRKFFFNYYRIGT